MSKAFRRWVIAIYSGNLITLAQLLASGDHPVCKVEHRPSEKPGPVDLRFEREPFQTDLFYLFHNSLSVIFGHELVLPVVHHYSFTDTNTSSYRTSVLATAAAEIREKLKAPWLLELIKNYQVKRH